MAKLISRSDFFVRVEEEGEEGKRGFLVQVHCPVCGHAVTLHLSSEDVEMRRAVSRDCTSGGHLEPFELEARYSPSETAFPDGVDVWGFEYSQAEYLDRD